MRKRILWLLTTVILCGATAVALCSCSDNDDNPAATTPIGDKIVGKWYAETPKQVTLGTGANAVECANRNRGLVPVPLSWVVATQALEMR